MREDMELARELAALPPSEFAKRIVRERPEFDTKQMLRQMASDMRISVNELASEIIASKTMVAEKEIASIVPTNSLYKTWEIEEKDGRFVAGVSWHYSPAKESIGKRQFEAGNTLAENSERRSMVKATILAEKATRQDYYFARHTLELVGKQKGFIVSSMPNGKVSVYSTHRAIDPEYAERLGEKAIAEFNRGQERIDAAQKAIAAAPLNKVPPAMKRELNKALDAMKVIRARVERANSRIHAANSKSADDIRLEFVAEFDAYENALPGKAAIESMELPNAIIRRPFRETLRIRMRRAPISPVECEVLRNESDAEWAAILEQFRIEAEKRNAAKAAEKAIADQAKRAETNANYKMREAARKRNSRAKAKRAGK